MWGCLANQLTPRRKGEQRGSRRPHSGRETIHSCPLHSREGLPSLQGGGGAPGQCGSWEPAGSEKVPRAWVLSGCLGELLVGQGVPELALVTRC